LSNDGRDIGGDILDIPRPGSGDTDMDVEKADIAFSRGVIVKWSSVRTIDINEVVDQAFVDKVVNWSYSRLPVIGKPDQHKSIKSARAVLPWGNTQIYGFLHVKVSI
jgi:Mg2+/Co2+ transporter CorC